MNLQFFTKPAVSLVLRVELLWYRIIILTILSFKRRLGAGVRETVTNVVMFEDDLLFAIDRFTVKHYATR